MGCFSTEPRRKQSYLAPMPSVKRFQWLVALVVVALHDTFKLLGVTFDLALTLDQHVTEVLRICRYRSHALWHICLLSIFDAAKMIAHSIVSSRLDYANSLLHGTSASNRDRLQVTQNSLARAVCQAPYSYDITRWHWACATELSATSLVANLPTHHLQDRSL